MEVDPKIIMDMARRAQSAERIAVQNAEYPNRERVVEKYQRQSDAAMEELAEYLGQPRY